MTAKTAEQGTDSITAKTTARDDGFVRVASLDEIAADTGLQITLNDQEYALFRAADKVHCIDNACPHEGAPLAEGSFLDGVVRCPWHDTGFHTCSGCGIDSPGQDVGSYKTLLHGDDVFMRPVTGSSPFANETSPATAAAALPISTPPAAIRRTAAVTAELPVIQVIDETPDVRTFCLDNSAAARRLSMPVALYELPDHHRSQRCGRALR